MSGDTPEAVVPVRRVSMTVTGYLRHGHPVGGWYDMQSQADGGEQYSVPGFAVDQATVTDLPPEALTDDDWSEIRSHIAGRLGVDAGERLLAQFRLLAAGHPAGELLPGGPGVDMLRSAAEGRQLKEWITSGEALRMRSDAGLRQPLVAQSLGVSQGALSRWEQGTRIPRGRNGVAYFGFLSGLAAAEAARAKESER